MPSMIDPPSGSCARADSGLLDGSWPRRDRYRRVLSRISGRRSRDGTDLLADSKGLRFTEGDLEREIAPDPSVSVVRAGEPTSNMLAASYLGQPFSAAGMVRFPGICLSRQSWLAPKAFQIVAVEMRSVPPATNTDDAA